MLIRGGTLPPQNTDPGVMTPWAMRTTMPVARRMSPVQSSGPTDPNGYGIPSAESSNTSQPFSESNLPGGFTWRQAKAPVTGDTVDYATIGPNEQLYVGPDNQFYDLHHMGDIAPGDISTSKINIASWLGLGSAAPVAPSTYTGPGADTPAQNGANYSADVPAGEVTSAPSNGATAFTPAQALAANEVNQTSATAGMALGMSDVLAELHTIETLLGQGPGSVSSTTQSGNTAGAGLAGDGPLVQALTDALNQGSQSPADAALPGGAGSSGSALDSLTPVAQPTAASSNPALVVLIALGAAGIGGWYYFTHKKGAHVAPKPQAAA